MNRCCALLLCSLLAGCGLTLDTSPPDDAGDPASADAGAGITDAGDRVDAATPPPMDARVLPGDDAGLPDAASPSDAGLDAGCADEDADGVSTCEGDCDDSDPTVYPAAPIICGDEIDNRCLGGLGDEEHCGGFGTFVSEDSGSNANPGTRALPVATIAQGQMHATRIGGGVDVYVAEGDYPETLAMQRDVSIHCGYEDGTWARDWTVHVTTITAESDLGVQFPAGTGRETELTGCVVEGRSNRATSHAVTFDAGSSGVLRWATVVGGDNESGMSVGVAVYPTGSDAAAVENRGRPLIEDSQISMGRAALWGLGTPATSVGISSNRTNLEVYRNTITLVDQQTAQRAILLRYPVAGTKVADNRIRPSAGRSEHVAGILVLGGSAEITRNDVFAGPCARWCVGIELLGAPSGLYITNNQIFAGESEMALSAGVLFEVEGASIASRLDVLIHSNLIVGARRGDPATGIGWLNESPSSFFIGGRVMSNIIYGGGGAAGYALWESGVGYDPERLEANMLHMPSSGAGSSPVLYLDEGAASLGRLAEINALAEHAGVPSRADDCQVLDPRPDGDPHLAPSSTCIDRGTSNEAPPVDIDGDTRPMGASADPGVDETRG